MEIYKIQAEKVTQSKSSKGAQGTSTCSKSGGGAASSRTNTSQPPRYPHSILNL